MPPQVQPGHYKGCSQRQRQQQHRGCRDNHQRQQHRHDIAAARAGRQDGPDTVHGALRQQQADPGERDEGPQCAAIRAVRLPLPLHQRGRLQAAAGMQLLQRGLLWQLLTLGPRMVPEAARSSSIVTRHIHCCQAFVGTDEKKRNTPMHMQSPPPVSHTGHAWHCFGCRAQCAGCVLLPCLWGLRSHPLLEVRGPQRRTMCGIGRTVVFV